MEFGIFPADAMPWVVQLEMVEFPSMHYVALAKAIFLQGTSITDLLFNFIALVILAVELFEIAAFAFRKKIIITFSLSNLFHRRDSAHKMSDTSTKQRKAEGRSI